MEQLSRRDLFRVGGTAGVVGTIAATMPAMPWTWSPAWSLPGQGSGADPRTVWDAEADPVVASILERGDARKVNAQLRTWTTNAQPLPAGLPRELRDFLDRARQLPSWTTTS